MMTYIAYALFHFCHKVMICIELLESLSFSIASCQSYRPPTTESCCFAKWRHLWQSWRTISAIATFSIYGSMVSARSRRTAGLITAKKAPSRLCIPPLSATDFNLVFLSAVVLTVWYDLLVQMWVITQTSKASMSILYRRIPLIKFFKDKRSFSNFHCELCQS